MIRRLPLVLLVACAAPPAATPPPNLDALGQRFTVESITLPTTTNQARTFADDLDGDGTADNQLGSMMAFLAEFQDANPHGSDMISAGSIAWTVYVRQAGSEGEVWMVGGPDAETSPVAGAFDSGAFASDRARDGATTGSATLALPVFADIDPTTLAIHDLEVELTPDGAGGFDANIHGSIDDGAALAGQGLLDMIVADPRAHAELIALLDTNKDGTLTADEIGAASFIRALLEPDLDIDGTRTLSVGFGAHLIPCPTGSCVASTPSCFDRVRDGDEVGIDCGGACGVACQAGDTCTAGTDCVSGTCDGGHCAEASCTDGHVDGLESDVDCGGGCTDRCNLGQTCLVNEDCGSLSCSTCSVDSLGEECTGPGVCN